MHCCQGKQYVQLRIVEEIAQIIPRTVAQRHEGFNPKRHSVLAPSKLKCDPSRKCSIGTERDVSLCGVKEQVLHYETCFLVKVQPSAMI